MTDEIENEIKIVAELMHEVVEDRGVPRNIRTTIEQAEEKITKKNPEPMDFSSAIYLLDDVSDDINMPYHTRTDLWEIISKLEALKEKMK